MSNDCKWNKRIRHNRDVKIDIMKNNSSFLIMAICLFLLQGCTIDYANAVDITLKNNLDSPITVVIQNRDLASQYDIAIIDRKCEHRIVHSGYMSGSPDIEHNDMFWDSEARMLLPLPPNRSEMIGTMTESPNQPYTIDGMPARILTMGFITL